MADGTVALNHDVGRRLRVEHTNGVGTQMQHMKLILVVEMLLFLQQSGNNARRSATSVHNRVGDWMSPFLLLLCI